MRSRLACISGGAVLIALFAYGCSCDGPHADDGLCSGPRPAASCDVPCSAEEPCPLSFYCAEQGVCTADCDPLVPGVGCADGICRDDGRCELIEDRPDSSVDARTDVCADVRVEATRVTPNVVLIIDQSSSMTASFGGSNRWDALRDSLLDEPDGFVASLEDSVRFGVALYSADQPNDDEPVPGECPLVTWIPPAISNFDAIQAVYGPADVVDETPTGQSVDWVLTQVTGIPDPSADPTIFILATDGEPDTCEQPNPQNGQAQSIAAVERAYLAGIRTFVISVGEGVVSEGHLQDIANAGLGGASGTDAEFWVAGDDAGLRDALTDIIGGELSCVVTLQGAIQNLDDACTGVVRVNGTTIPCDDPDGWRAIDSTHIELSGEACDTLQSGPGVTLEAIFPCDIILI